MDRKKQLQEQVQKQGGRPTPEQQLAWQQLEQQETSDAAEMQKLDSILGDNSSQQSNGPLGGLTGNGGPLGAATGITSGLTGGGGPLNTVTGTASGLTGGGGPLGGLTDTAGGLTGGLGGLTSGLPGGDTLGGLNSGLLGSGQGLNVAGLLAIGMPLS